MQSFIDTLQAYPFCQLVLGSRQKGVGREISRKAIRHVAGRLIATLATLVLRQKIYDTQCGAKIFRINHEITQIFDTPFTVGWLFDLEILLRLRQGQPFQLTVVEKPLAQWRDIGPSKVRWFDFFGALWGLFSLERQYNWSAPPLAANEVEIAHIS